MKLTLGFSPCPNDTFIFDALVNQKISTNGIEFELCIADVESLNKWALEGKLDITKLSFPAFFKSTDHYLLLNSGAALGKGVGPLLITAKNDELATDKINNFNIVLPGENTTAHLLFSFAYPGAEKKQFMPFDEIEDYVLAHPDDTLGVIIHESRFTYKEKGLSKIADLGEFWENKTHGPVPLGGIAINQGVKRTVALTVNKLIRQSVDYAFNHYPLVPPFVKEHSQAMSEDIMRQHINLYVNQYSLDLSEDGREAVSKMYELFCNLHGIECESPDLLFL